MRLILFDIDMTLIHTNGAGRLAMVRVLREWFGVDDPTAGISFDGRTDRAIFNDVLTRLAAADPEASARLANGYAGMTESYLAGLPAALAERGGSLLPGVAALLDALESRGAVFGLATGNMRRGAYTKLAHFGIDHRFPGGGFGDDVTVRGELVEAGIVELAKLAGHVPDPPSAIVLGDTPLDIEAAHVAGARAFGVATGRFSVDELTAAGADWALADLADTAAVLEILAAG